MIRCQLPLPHCVPADLIPVNTIPSERIPATHPCTPRTPFPNVTHISTPTATQPQPWLFFLLLGGFSYFDEEVRSRLTLVASSLTPPLPATAATT